MVGFLAKQPRTFEEEERPVEVIDQDPKVKAFKDTLDFPSVDSFLDFDSCNWLGNTRNIEEFSIEDTDFDFFGDEMEIGQEGVTVSEEARLENQNTVMSSSTEVNSELCGEASEQIRTSSIRSESMIEVKTELCGGMSEDIGAIKSASMIEVEPKLCDDMSANFLSVAEAAAKESEAVVSDNSKPMEGETVPVACPTMSLDESALKKTDESLASSIELGLEKVSLTRDDDEKTDGAKEKTNSAESESETSSSSSSASDSSSSEEEESDEDDEEESEEEENRKEKKFDDQMVMGKKDDMAGELEEGEIESVDEDDKNEVEDDDDDDDDDDDEVNEMIAWSNDEDEDLGLQTKEPIRSKNELKELPPVPAVDVTLEPHHVMLPVGVVSSVMSTQVIVEGMENHSPLTEGSILWTDRRTPLGLVDEIFGPVKCPYYIVRFNSESEVPEGICQGTHVSFVADFAQHILNIKELQKKGYDASGDNDEEIADELEFSDDEKEAEYRRMQKMEKRGMMNDQKTGNTRNKKKKNRDLGRPTSSYSGEWAENQGPSSLSSSRSDTQMGGPVSNHQPRPQMDGCPPNGGAWRPQSNQQNPYQLPPIPNQMGMPNLAPMQMPFPMQNQNQMMFQPQFNGGQMSMPSGPGGLNFFPGQASAPWPALVGQNCFNQQPFGMGRGIQHPQLPNELNFNLFASQGFQMHQPQSQMHRPQSPMNPQFQMQPQSETRPQSQVLQSPTKPQSPVQPHSQGFNSGQSSDRGRGHRGRGRGRGRGRFGRGRGRGRQQSG